MQDLQNRRKTKQVLRVNWSWISSILNS